MTEPRHSRVSPVRLEPDLLEKVEAHLRAEAILVYPTETVYGMGCLIRKEALARLFELKHRDLLKPVLLLVTDEVKGEGLRWTDPARKLAEQFWPGPLTLVLADPEGVYPPGVRSEAGGVAIRETPHPLARLLVNRLAEPITSTSVNAPGETPARTGGQALEVARAMGAGDGIWVLDSGPLPAASPSTVVDCTGSEPLIRRRGAISSAHIFSALQETA